MTGTLSDAAPPARARYSKCDRMLRTVYMMGPQIPDDVSIRTICGGHTPLLLLRKPNCSAMSLVDS